MSIAWSWPFIVKLGVIIFIAILGLVIGPKWLFSLIGWSLFLALLLVPPIIIKAQTKYVMELNGKRVTEVARYLQWFYGGKIGQFWSDWAKAFAFYVDNKQDAGDEILATWQGEGVPDQLRSLTNDYRFYGYTLARDWPRVISEYESLKGTTNPISNQLCLSACRAYAETKKFDMAADCLSMARPPETKSSVYDLAPAFLQFFCLTGDEEKTKQLLTILVDLKHPLPGYARSYWFARMALAKGDKQEARAQFAIALKLSESSAIWQSRIRDQINTLDSVSSDSQVDSDAILAKRAITGPRAEAVENAWDMYRKMVRAMTLVSPMRKSSAVTTLIWLILVAFILSYSYSLLPGSGTAMLTKFCFGGGMLMPERVSAGEYWRLFTCLFLHLHFLHLLFNLIGLWWFGTMAANIFGTKRFLLIYCVSGVASGAVYVLLGSSAPAIGASGAIMGVFGAVAAGIFRLRSELPPAIRRRQLLLMMSLVLLQVVMDQIIPHVGASIHLFGLITGALLGLVLPLSRSQEKRNVQTF